MAPSWDRRVVAALGKRIPGIASLLGFLLLWYLLTVVTDISEILLPKPGSVWSQFVEVWQKGLLWPSVLDSMRALVMGLSVAIAVGVTMGLIIGAFPLLDLIASPYLWGFFATPRIAMAPLFVLWFGFGLTTKFWLIFVSALLPILLSCKEGVQTVDQPLIHAARSFGATKRQLFVHVVVPYTLPFIASGVRNGIARGFVGLLIIEMTVGSGGIGTQVMRSMRTFNSARMFAYVFVLMVVAMTLITVSRRIEARLSRWREEVYV